jgi:hypothetical protein
MAVLWAMMFATLGGMAAAVQLNPGHNAWRCTPLL